MFLLQDLNETVSLFFENNYFFFVIWCFYGSSSLRNCVSAKYGYEFSVPCDSLFPEELLSNLIQYLCFPDLLRNL